MSLGSAIYPYPRELDGLALDRSGLVEASAGTGKTYLLEHLFIHLLLRTDATADRLLVVTFTERATAELRVRIASRIDEVLATTTTTPGEHGWRLDGVARAKLHAARAIFESAPVSTIHGFCQRVLSEQPFLTRRLMAGAPSDGAQLFASSFREVLRRRLAVSPTYAPYLAAWLGAGEDIAGLERATRKARSLGVTLPQPFSPQRLVETLEAFLAADPATALRNAGKTKFQARYVEKRLLALQELAVHALSQGDLESRAATFLVRLAPDALSFLQFASGNLEGPKAAFFDDDLGNPKVLPAQQATRALLAAAPPLLAVLVERALPAVDAHLDERKLAEGMLDFDDLIRFVERELDGPSAEPLIASLRNRFRFALVDEFQDTDPRQWRIFERLFFQGGSSNPLYLVGDPKQAIYGFRSADVHTYLGAKTSVVAGGGSRLDLVANFRSSPALVEALNRVFDQTADAPFFPVSPHAPAILFDPPATPGRAPSGRPEAPLTLLRLETTSRDDKVARLPEVRRALQVAIARDLREALDREPELLAPGHGVFILTRTTVEMREIGEALAVAAIPYRFHREERLLMGEEAQDVLDVLRAIEAPLDPSLRAVAWLTPFFGLTLAELAPAMEQDDFHPLLAAFARWSRLAAERAFGRLFSALLDETGLARRLIAENTAEGLRRLAAYRHLFDLLLRIQTRGHADLGTLLPRFAALVSRQVEGDDAEDDIYPVASEEAGVEVMTMHRAKGLEADRVYLYGAFGSFNIPRTEAVTYLDPASRRRVLSFGRPAWRADQIALKAERASDDQRLMYVALTRARHTLVLPHFPAVPSTVDETWEESITQPDLFKRVNGGYRHVNRRLDELAGDAAFQSLVRTVRVPFPLPEAEMRAWDTVRVPPPPELHYEVLQARPPFDPRARLFEEARQRARGLTVASYTRLQGLRGEQDEGAPEADVDQDAPRAEADDRFDESATESATETMDPPLVSPAAELPLSGGAASGVLLHDLLEKMPLEDIPAWETFKTSAHVLRIADLTLARHGRDAAEREPALRLVHTALSHAWPVGEPPLASLGRASRVIREMEFLYPARQSPRTTPVVVKGFVDVLFEHQGRVYLADWKSDGLRSYEPAALELHVVGHYALQARLYMRALVRMLGLTTEAAYHARVGGMFFVFLRGLTAGGPPGESITGRRPTWAEIQDEATDLRLTHVTRLTDMTRT